MCPLSPRTSHWNPTLCQVALIAVQSQLCWTAWPKTTVRWQLGYGSKHGCQLPCLHLIPHATLVESSLLMSFFEVCWDDMHSSVPSEITSLSLFRMNLWGFHMRDCRCTVLQVCTDSIWEAWFTSLGKRCTSDTADHSRISFQTSVLQTQSAQLSSFQLFLSIKCLLFLRICPSWPSHISLTVCACHVKVCANDLWLRPTWLHPSRCNISNQQRMHECIV